jgi:hypothetical protein
VTEVILVHLSQMYAGDGLNGLPPARQPKHQLSLAACSGHGSLVGALFEG